MTKVIALEKICSSCGQPKPIFKGDNCPECLEYFHDQWKVTFGPPDQKKEEKEHGRSN